MPTVRTYRPVSGKRKKAQRTSHQAFSSQRLTAIIIGMSFCALCLWGYFHGSALVTGISYSTQMAFAKLGFRLEDVIVEGRMRTDKALILKELNVGRGTPLLSINLSEAKIKLEGISWIKSVRVERRFPDTLFIRISEKEPVALWLNQAKTYLVDRDGELVETQEVHKYKNLLIVTGHQAPREVGKLIALLDKFPEIRSRVTAATHLRSNRWDIRLDDKMDVKLPEKEADQALAYLLDLERTHHLIDKEVITIDMRLPGQLIFRLTPEAAQEKNNKGKDV